MRAILCRLTHIAEPLDRDAPLLRGEGWGRGESPEGDFAYLWPPIYPPGSNKRCSHCCALVALQMRGNELQCAVADRMGL